MSLTRLARESLDRYGEYVALAFEGRRYTNLEQDRAAGRLANALRRLGVCPGDRVMVMLPNCPEVTQSYAAILKCGGVIVPVIFLLGDREVAHILADSEARIVITSADMLWKVEAQIGVLPSLRHVLLVDGGGDGKTRSLGAEAAQEEESFATVERRSDDLAVILYTSGTTGVPKGVALSHDNLESNARAAAALHELEREDWAVSVLPLSHSYGLTVMNAGHILGSRAALLRWFNPEEVLRTIQQFRAVSMSAVPTMLLYLLNFPDAERFDTGSMRVWGSGAAPLPAEIVEPFESSAAGSSRATGSPRPRRWCPPTASPGRARSARWGKRFPASKSRSRTTAIDRYPSARWARCASAVATSWPATIATRRRRRGRCGRGGSTPGTWAAWTRTASSSSWSARRI